MNISHLSRSISSWSVNLALVAFALYFSPSVTFSQSGFDSTLLLFEAMPVPTADSDSDIVFASLGELLERGDTSKSNIPTLDALKILELNQNIEQYLASSSDAEADIGPFSNELKEDLLSLAFLYQQLGDHQEAINYYERSQIITRANDGLSSLDQLPIIEAMIPSYEAMNKLKEADDMQDSLVYIIQQAYGEESLEVAPALSKLGEWNMQAFLERSSILINIKRINVVNFLSESNYSFADQTASNTFLPPEANPRGTPLFKLYQAQNNFLNSINIIIQNKDYTHPQLLDLERNLLTTYFLRTHQENILYEPDFYLTRKKRSTGTRLNTNQIELMNSEDYRTGMASHKRSIAYLRFDPDASTEALARAMLEDADWDLLYERKVVAARKYQAVYDYFVANPELEALAFEVLYPEVPQLLPTYLPPPNSREKLNIPADEEVEYLGYYDVSFRINKYGKTSRVKILSSAGNVDSNMENRLKKYLRNILFRPKFENGETVTDTILLRYNVAY